MEGATKSLLESKGFKVNQSFDVTNYSISHYVSKDGNNYKCICYNGSKSDIILKNIQNINIIETQYKQMYSVIANHKYLKDKVARLVEIYNEGDYKIIVFESNNTLKNIEEHIKANNKYDVLFSIFMKTIIIFYHLHLNHIVFGNILFNNIYINGDNIKLSEINYIDYIVNYNRYNYTIIKNGGINPVKEYMIGRYSNNKQLLPPENTLGSIYTYTCESDMWFIGILFFKLLFVVFGGSYSIIDNKGTYLFTKRDNKKLLYVLLFKTMKYKEYYLIDVINGLLNANRAARLTPFKILTDFNTLVKQDKNKSEIKLMGDSNKQLSSNYIHHNIVIRSSIVLPGFQDRCYSEEYLKHLKLRVHSYLVSLRLAYLIAGEYIAELFSVSLPTPATLRFLDLTYNEMGPGGISIMKEQLAKACCLSKLHLSDNALGEQGIKDFSQVLYKLGGLKFLYLTWNDINDAAMKSLINPLKQLHKLQKLSFSCNQMGDEAAITFAPTLQYLPDLYKLDFGFNTLTHTSIIEMVKYFKYVPSLKKFILHNNNIGVEGTKAIANNLHYTTRMLHLNLYRNGLGSEGVEYLANYVKFIPHITTLNICHNNIGDSQKIIAQKMKEANISEEYLYYNSY